MRTVTIGNVTAEITDDRVLITRGSVEEVQAIINACASVGIEHGKGTGEMLAAYFLRQDSEEEKPKP